MRVKVCGITNLDDALAAVDAGADAVGFNFWPGSKRRVSVEDVAAVLPGLPAGVLTVGVFVNAPRAEIERVLQSLQLSAVQLHGDEAPEDCAGYPVKVIKALQARTDVARQAERYTTDYVLLDADVGTLHGGGGRTFLWSLAKGVAPGRLFLAGGLTPGNVAEAVRAVRPFAVDVASGVEREPRRKDHEKMRQFIHNAKAA